VYISYRTAAGNAIISQLGSSCQGRRYDTVRHGQSIMLYWVTLLQPARRAAVLGQLSSLPPHWSNKPSYTEINISTVQNRMYIGTVHQYSRQLGNFYQLAKFRGDERELFILSNKLMLIVSPYAYVRCMRD
jgi:hypothetical protein